MGQNTGNRGDLAWTSVVCALCGFRWSGLYFAAARVFRCPHCDLRMGMHDTEEPVPADR